MRSKALKEWICYRCKKPIDFEHEGVTAFRVSDEWASPLEHFHHECFQQVWNAKYNYKGMDQAMVLTHNLFN